jgi:hypothetical protein
VILIESVPKTDPRMGEVIPKREMLSTDMRGLSTEKRGLIKREIGKTTLNWLFFRG